VQRHSTIGAKLVAPMAKKGLTNSTKGAILHSVVAHSALPINPERSTMQRDTLDILKAEAEIAKMMAETAKLNREGRFYPLVIASTILGASAAMATVFVALIKLF
jgi:hypothetical protein